MHSPGGELEDDGKEEKYVAITTGHVQDFFQMFTFVETLWSLMPVGRSGVLCRDLVCFSVSWAIPVAPSVKLEQA